MDLGHGSSLKKTSDSVALVSAASLGLMGLVGISRVSKKLVAYDPAQARPEPISGWVGPWAPI